MEEPRLFPNVPCFLFLNSPWSSGMSSLPSQMITRCYTILGVLHGLCSGDCKGHIDCYIDCVYPPRRDDELHHYVQQATRPDKKVSEDEDVEELESSQDEGEDQDTQDEELSLDEGNAS